MMLEGWRCFLMIAKDPHGTDSAGFNLRDLLAHVVFESADGIYDLYIEKI